VVPSGRMECCGAIQEAWNVLGRCNASQDTQDAWHTENTSLMSGHNAGRSDAGSVFADVASMGAFSRRRKPRKKFLPFPLPR